MRTSEEEATWRQEIESLFPRFSWCSGTTGHLLPVQGQEGQEAGGGTASLCLGGCLRTPRYNCGVTSNVTEMVGVARNAAEARCRGEGAAGSPGEGSQVRGGRSGMKAEVVEADSRTSWREQGVWSRVEGPSGFHRVPERHRQGRP